MEPLGDEERHEELFTLNIGPHHPATHGVLRLLTTLEGEVVRDIKPIIGYVHTGIEKSCEDQQYWKVITFVERMDYLAYYFNATRVLHGGRAAARGGGAAARAVPARRAHGAEPDRLPPVRARHRRARPGRGDDALVGLPRPRPGARPVRDVVRPAHAPALHPGRRRLRGHPARLGEEGARVPQDHAHAPRPVPGPARPQRDLARAAQGHRGDVAGARARAGRDRAAAARHRPPVGPAQGDALLVLRGLRLRGAGRPPSATTTTASRSAWTRCASRSRSSSRRSTACPRARSSPTTARSRCRRATSWPPRWRRSSTTSSSSPRASACRPARPTWRSSRRAASSAATCSPTARPSPRACTCATPAS